LRQILPKVAQISTKLFESLSSNNGLEVPPLSTILKPPSSIRKTAANGFTKEAFSIIEEIRNQVAKINEKILQIDLPDPACKYLIGSTAYTAEVCRTDVFDMVVFGLVRADSVIPLHDHYKIYGFIKPLRGSIEVTSYSWLAPEEESRLIYELKDRESKRAGDFRPARFEGNRIFSASDVQDRTADPIAILGPTTGNIHQVKALTDGATFFDLLIPGYIETYTCNYYALTDEENKAPKNPGQIVWLKLTSDPIHFTMEHINYEPPLFDSTDEDDVKKQHNK